jgi:hypothetical protein
MAVVASHYKSIDATLNSLSFPSTLQEDGTSPAACLTAPAWLARLLYRRVGIMAVIIKPTGDGFISTES